MSNEENVDITNPEESAAPEENLPIPESDSGQPNEVPPSPEDTPPAPSDDSTTPTNEDVTPSDDSIIENAIVDEEANREKLLADFQSQRDVIESQAQALTDEINEKELAAEEFAYWVDRHRRTFLWKMFAKMRNQLDAVIAKQNGYETTMSNIELPEPGELVRLRKRFHKTILSVFSVSFFVWLVYYLITTYVPFIVLFKISIIVFVLPSRIDNLSLK